MKFSLSATGAPVSASKEYRSHVSWSGVGVVVAVSAFAALSGGAIGVIGPLAAVALIAMITGIGLLFRPNWMVSLILAAGLLAVGVVPLFAEGAAAKATWSVSALGLMLLCVAITRPVFDPKIRKETPAFVWAVVVFLIYCLLNSAVRVVPLFEIFGGTKRYFQVAGLTFAMAWMSFHSEDVARWKKVIFIAALLQLPWAVYQLVRLVPFRESVRNFYPGMIPIDVVAGTFGASLYGGGANAEMATFLIILLGFALARIREGVLRPVLFFVFLPVLAPLFLGETKVVVVLLPMLFFTLYRKEIVAKPVVASLGVILGLLLTLAAGYTYSILTNKPIEYQVQDIVKYNLQDKGYGTYVLNRTTAVTFWFQRQGLSDPIGAVFGSGLGTAHTSTGGELSEYYSGYGIDLTTVSTLLWEQGPFGLFLFVAILYFAWGHAGHLVRTSSSALIRADAAAIQSLMPLFAFYMIYRVAFLESMPFQIVFYGVLGYLALLSRSAREPGVATK